MAFDDLSLTEDVDATLWRARRVARAMRHAAVTVEHLLLALTDDVTVCDALDAHGVAVARWVAELRAFTLRTAARTPRWTLFGPPYHAELRAVMARLGAWSTGQHARRVGLPEVAGAAVDAAVPPTVHPPEGLDAAAHPYRASDEQLVHPLHAARCAGLRGVDVMAHLVHGVRCDAAAVAPVAGPARAVALNDEFTTFEFVIDVLRDEFGLAAAEAELVATRAHAAGRAEIVRGEGGALAPRVQRAVARAREAWLPLAIRLEPVAV